MMLSNDKITELPQWQPITKRKIELKLEINKESQETTAREKPSFELIYSVIQRVITVPS